ncbi:FecR family protein [Mucilaginibacter ximonensis]|uniref:FecR family protein n=1 Tax=Mucilaginibacter ximonensis TaxID=538021 RepID=A0ABW5YAL2_9SPHI
MDDQSEYIKILFSKYASGKASAEEVEEFLELLSQGTFDQEISSSMQDIISKTTPDASLDHRRWARVLADIKEQGLLPSRNTKLRWNLGIAASIAIVIGSFILLFYKKPLPQQSNLSSTIVDRSPGQNSATLTLGNGKKIKLIAAANGKLAVEPGAVITKSAEGEIIYDSTAQASTPAPNQYNTLSTANGETYHLKLPDGSEVWLNAASSLSYKASLIEDGKRMVRLTGEAYFQVAKDKKHPFIVASEKQEIKVLGTHFNVNTYKDEPAVRTTLLEGSVQITSVNGNTIKMKPGQEVSMVGATFSTANVDPEDAVAWTKDQLQFDNKTVPEIMRQIARWYDVQVIFNSDIPEGTWTGAISRQRRLSQVLRMMQKSNEVKFKFDGKKLYVSK